MLIALYIALIREPREAFEAHKYHVARMDALQRIKSERFGAQARKLVPSCVRTPMLGDNAWAVRIDNAASNATTILKVGVTAVDDSGTEMPGSARRVDHATSVDPDVQQSIRLALSESLGTGRNTTMSRAIRHAIRDAVAVHFVDDWPRTLPPSHHAVMCYATESSNHKLRVTIDYEDEAGFQWRRTDTGQPTRTDNWEIGQR
ncbi:hypothetical protein [Mycobacterium aquaticum]|uniref:hypothetical protein n=1 Tax=Mycobacterium aquaticum TaxID=1927124 RepID=UPI0011507711|nr:hypothetical protein [Mycobacterium aquaticum]